MCPLCHGRLTHRSTPAMYVPASGGLPVFYSLCQQCSKQMQEATEIERQELTTLVEASLEGASNA